MNTQKFHFLLVVFAVFLLISMQTQVRAQKIPSIEFQCVVLGSGGGIEENNLSAYLLAPVNSNEYICLDAGTVYSGIEQAVRLGNFPDVFLPQDSEATKTGYIFRELIKGYLISHAHLDHIAGLVISSPAAISSKIYAGAQTIDYLKNDIFNWDVWPNFTSEGKGMPLGVFDYKVLDYDTATQMQDTRFDVTAFPISHQEPYESTAFLLEYYDNYVLYIGDTGPDQIEGKTNLRHIWQNVAPLIRDGKLNAMFLECSYPDEQPDNKLYGHLTPRWVTAELDTLASLTVPENPESALKGLPVIVTGIKPSWKAGDGNKYVIYRQLLTKNKLGVKFIIPEQGQLIEF